MNDMRRPNGIFALLRTLWTLRARAARPLGKKRWIGVGLAAATIALFGAEISIRTAPSKPRYAKHVDELMAAPDRFVGKRERVVGEVCGPIRAHETSPCLYRFTMMGSTSLMSVELSACALPDTLRDDTLEANVTVDGELAPDDVFYATQILARCHSKYDSDRARPPRAACPLQRAPPAAR